jgi:hypothetical protein
MISCLQFLSFQILSTLKVGAEALKQNKVSMSEVDEIMDQLDEVKYLSLYSIVGRSFFDVLSPKFFDIAFEIS